MATPTVPTPPNGAIDAAIDEVAAMPTPTTLTDQTQEMLPEPMLGYYLFLRGNAKQIVPLREQANGMLKAADAYEASLQSFLAYGRNIGLSENDQLGENGEIFRAASRPLAAPAPAAPPTRSGHNGRMEND